jgi:hypothetical protein
VTIAKLRALLRDSTDSLRDAIRLGYKINRRRHARASAEHARKHGRLLRPLLRLSVDEVEDVIERSILIYCLLYPGDSSGNQNVNGGYGWYTIANETTHNIVTTALSAPNGTPAFTGSMAEYIMDRPEISGSYTPLANYYFAEMTFAGVGEVNGAVTSFGTASGATSDNCYMETSDLLSKGFAADNSDVHFIWYAAQ